MDADELRHFKTENAALKAELNEKLGKGYGGLKKNNDTFSHEEIVFLFARVFNYLGFDSIKEIRTPYPDCICIRDDKEVTIEFEPLLSAFRDHLNKDDISECQYIVCWDNDTKRFDAVSVAVDKHNIVVIKLKEVYKELATRKKRFTWIYNETFFRNLHTNQKELLKVYIETKKDILSIDEIRDYTKLAGRGLGGFLSGFTQTEKYRGDYLIRKQRGKKKFTSYELNPKYRSIISKLIENGDI